MRYIVWSMAGLLILVAVGVALFLYDAKVGFGAPAHPSFMGYKPTALPHNVHVTGQSLTRQRMAVGIDAWYFHYSLKLSSSELTISENQRQSDGPHTVSCQGYGGYCDIYRTAQGNTYRVWYNSYQNKPFGMEVSWIKDDTDVDISVSDTAIAQYLSYNWDTVFDSMQPVDLSHMPYTKYASCGCGG